MQSSHTTDITTEDDMAVSMKLIDLFKKQKIQAILYSEEAGEITILKNPQFTITFDDIDGTGNYHRGRGLLPYCTVVTIFDSINPLFENVLIAGIIEHNSGDIWHAVRNEGCFLNDRRVQTTGKNNLDRSALVIIDHYASHKDINKLLSIYSKSWVKDFGSAAFHMAGISSGMFDGYISYAQKAHELGAGYLLVKEAGGFLQDLYGNPLDELRYEFDRKYNIVAASTEKLGKILLTKLK
ncbi:MAG: hypothetical protein JSV25_03165 [Spirochaetota bacterium]|nr:MAG: hypothetical protein JSV25_03165 [Spirochaetota bacterium]